MKKGTWNVLWIVQALATALIVAVWVAPWLLAHASELWSVTLVVVASLLWVAIIMPYELLQLGKLTPDNGFGRGLTENFGGIVWLNLVLVIALGTVVAFAFALVR